MGGDAKYISRQSVRKRYGNISNMTLWRWEHDPHLGFPKPIEINGRLYQSVAALEAWERARAASTKGRGTKP